MAFLLPSCGGACVTHGSRGKAKLPLNGSQAKADGNDTNDPSSNALIFAASAEQKQPLPQVFRSQNAMVVFVFFDCILVHVVDRRGYVISVTPLMFGDQLVYPMSS